MDKGLILEAVFIALRLLLQQLENYFNYIYTVMKDIVRSLSLSYSESRSLLIKLFSDDSLTIEINKKETAFTASKDNHKILHFMIPPILYDLKEVLFQKPLSIPEEIENYYILLIQAGHSALAYCEDGEILLHKVISKYMVRKGQGKSQIKYLKTKGKSRAGSRVRLAKALEFFEEINEKLNDWFEEKGAAKVLYSCTPTLLPFLFQSKAPPPFDKKDEHLVKIPLDVNKPCFKELSRVNHFILRGKLEIYDETFEMHNFLC